MDAARNSECEAWVETRFPMQADMQRASTGEHRAKTLYQRGFQRNKALFTASMFNA